MSKSRKPGNGLLRTDWSRKAYELLSDGEPRSYTEVFAEVMNAVPPSRAIQAYHSNKGSKKNLSLEEQINYGTKRVVDGALRSNSFVIEDPATGEKAYPRIANRHLLTIRINPDVYDQIAPLNEIRRRQLDMRRQTITDKEVIESIVRNKTSKIIAMERGLIEKYPMPDGRKGFPVYSSQGNGVRVAGFIVIDSDESAEIVVTWPKPDSRAYGSVENLFSRDPYSWAFLREAVKEHQ